jgi:hypothetical protein
MHGYTDLNLMAMTQDQTMLSFQPTAKAATIWQVIFRKQNEISYWDSL